MASICVVHLVRAKNGIQPLRRFLETYGRNRGGVDHDFLIIFKGFPGRKEPAAFEQQLADHAHRSIFVGDFGYHVTSYLEVARALEYPYVCFLNSYSLILDMTVPFTLQLAYGWIKLSLLKNVIAVIVRVPSLIWLTNHYGAIGATCVWMLLNGGYFLIEIPIMHRRLLKPEMWRWYFQEIGKPLLIILGIIVCSHVLMPSVASPTFLLTWIVLTVLIAAVLANLAMPFTREWF